MNIIFYLLNVTILTEYIQIHQLPIFVTFSQTGKNVCASFIKELVKII